VFLLRKKNKTNINNKEVRKKLQEIFMDGYVYGLDGSDGFTGLFLSTNLLRCIY
jgi:hypothetical protein